MGRQRSHSCGSGGHFRGIMQRRPWTMVEILRTLASAFFAIVLLEIAIIILFTPGFLTLAISRTSLYLREKVDTAGGFGRFWLEGLMVTSLLVPGLLAYLFNTKAWFDRTLLWMANAARIHFRFSLGVYTAAFFSR